MDNAEVKGAPGDGIEDSNEQYRPPHKVRSIQSADRDRSEGRLLAIDRSCWPEECHLTEGVVQLPAEPDLQFRDDPPLFCDDHSSPLSLAMLYPPPLFPNNFQITDPMKADEPPRAEIPSTAPPMPFWIHYPRVALSSPLSLIRSREYCGQDLRWIGIMSRWEWVGRCAGETVTKALLLPLPTAASRPASQPQSTVSRPSQFGLLKSTLLLRERQPLGPF